MHHWYSIECRFVYFHLTHLSVRVCVLNYRSHTFSTGFECVSCLYPCISTCVLCVVYVCIFSCLYVCTYSPRASFCVYMFNVRARVSWCPCSLFKVMMFSLEELAVKKSYSETQSVVATLSCTRMQLWHWLKSYRVWLWGDAAENVSSILTV